MSTDGDHLGAWDYVALGFVVLWLFLAATLIIDKMIAVVLRRL